MQRKMFTWCNSTSYAFHLHSWHECIPSAYFLSGHQRPFSTLLTCIEWYIIELNYISSETCPSSWSTTFICHSRSVLDQMSHHTLNGAFRAWQLPHDSHHHHKVKVIWESSKVTEWYSTICHSPFMMTLCAHHMHASSLSVVR